MSLDGDRALGVGGCGLGGGIGGIGGGGGGIVEEAAAGRAALETLAGLIHDRGDGGGGEEHEGRTRLLAMARGESVLRGCLVPPGPGFGVLLVGALASRPRSEP